MASFQFGAPVSPDLGISAPPTAPQTAEGAAIANAGSVQVRAGNGAARVQMGPDGLEVSNNGVSRVQMASVSNGSDGILATANRDGAPKPAASLRPTDKVTIGGMETTLAVAERLGAVTRDAATGVYQNVSEGQLKEVNGAAQAERKQAAAVTEAAKAKEAAQAARLPDAASEQAAAEIESSVTPGTATRALLDIIDTGNVRSGVLERAASEAGIQPAEMGAKLGAAMKGFQAQAAAFAAQRGVDMEQFTDWARTHHAGDLKNAMQRHVQQRDVGAYGALVGRYMENLDRIDPQSILSAKFPDTGMSAFKAADGRIVLNIPGHGQVSWSAAVKAGLVSPRRS